MNTVHAVFIHDKDSCVTVTSSVFKGDAVVYQRSSGAKEQVVANADVPIYHKVAVVPVKKEDFVYKYGSRIGIAKEDIAVGDYIHTHNLKPVGFVEEV